MDDSWVVVVMQSTDTMHGVVVGVVAAVVVEEVVTDEPMNDEQGVPAKDAILEEIEGDEEEDAARDAE